MDCDEAAFSEGVHQKFKTYVFNNVHNGGETCCLTIHISVYIRDILITDNYEDVQHPL